MGHALSESAVVRAVAGVAVARITRKVILALQQLTDTLSGDDSELKTTWDEVCVQVQIEHSFYWDSYEDTVRALVAGHVEHLARHERAAIWLQTDDGIRWSCEDPDDSTADPVIDDDCIVDYITREGVLVEAGHWSNPRIRAYIDRTSGTD